MSIVENFVNQHFSSEYNLSNKDDLYIFQNKAKRPIQRPFSTFIVDSKIILLKKLPTGWSNLAAISHGLEDMNYFWEILYIDPPTSSEKRSGPIEI